MSELERAGARIALLMKYSDVNRESLAALVNLVASGKLDGERWVLDIEALGQAMKRVRSNELVAAALLKELGA